MPTLYPTNYKKVNRSKNQPNQYINDSKQGHCNQTHKDIDDVTSETLGNCTLLQVNGYYHIQILQLLSLCQTAESVSIRAITLGTTIKWGYHHVSMVPSPDVPSSIDQPPGIEDSGIVHFSMPLMSNHVQL